MSGIAANLKKKRMPVKAAPDATPNTNKRRESARRRRLARESQAKIDAKARKAAIYEAVKHKLAKPVAA